MSDTLITRPPALEPGARIAVIAPSSCFPRDAFDAGVAWLRSRGFSPWWRDDIFERRHYTAGDRARRLREWNEALADPSTRAIWCVRGGYGVMQLLRELEVSPLRTAPRMVIGGSDITPLLNMVAERVHVVTVHGPMICGIPRTHRSSLERMLTILGEPTCPPPDLVADHGRIIAPGRARGRLCGGNLSMIAATLGTPYALETRGRILCLEDVGERPYRIDRLVEQLMLAGLPQRAAGIVLGEFTRCTEADGRGRAIEEIMEEHFRSLKIPVLSGFPFGHGHINEILPIGAPVELDTDRRRIRFLGPVVA